MRPQTKKTNIHAKKILARAGAAPNSCQTKIPQQAEIIVAPCPIEYETAGPTTWVREATKLSDLRNGQSVLPSYSKFLLAIFSAVLYRSGAWRRTAGVLPWRAAHNAAEGLSKGALGFVAE